MNTVLNVLNFLGVLFLVGLSAMQWKDNSRLHADVDHLQQTRQEQLAKIADQDKAIKGYTSDLDDLHKRLDKSDADLKEAGSKLKATTVERDQIAGLRDQLNTQIEQDHKILDQWKKAVAQRDDALKQLSDQIQKLNAQVRDAQQRYSDMVNKYNGVVNELNAKTAGH